MPEEAFPSLTIQPMTADTVAAVANLERICFADPWSPDALRDELRNPLARYFVAELSGEVVGYAGLHHILDEGHITNIAVAPARRRAGVGRGLLAAVLRYADVHSLRLLTLEVRASNAAAIDLYEAHGFRQMGLRKRYYRHPAEDALIMTLLLSSI